MFDFLSSRSFLCTLFLLTSQLYQPCQSFEGAQLAVSKKPLNTLLKHRLYTFEGNYPVFKGSPTIAVNQLNRVLQSTAKDYFPGDEGWSNSKTVCCTTDFDAHYKKHNLVSVVMTLSTCFQDAPHPVSSVRCFNYRLLEGKTGAKGTAIKELSLGDLLGKNANYKLAAKMLTKTLRSAGDSVETNEPLKLSPKDQDFVFDNKGIAWRWGDYSMGSYVGGARSGYLTYKQLKSVASKDSLVDKLASYN